MLAFAMMAVVRERANSFTSPKKETTRPGCSAGAMVSPGNLPRRHMPSSAPDRACLRDRMVQLATSASGHGASHTSQTKGATVVLN